MQAKTDCTIAILAGGRSSRMHTDKAQILWEGVSFLERTVQAAVQISSHVVVVGRDRPEDWDGPECDFIGDEEPGSGPLGGLIAALHQAQGRCVLLLAVDMPLLTEVALRWLYDRAKEIGTDNDGIAVSNAGQLEPLFSVFAASSLSLAEASIESGRRSLKRVIEQGNFVLVELPEVYQRAICNVNTSEELERIRKQP
jgi:molybdopterin-guanine dinucleotide biosynthesis protein A